MLCTESAQNTEAKWPIYPTKLGMEFNYKILHVCASTKENVLGIHAGAKFLLATKVIICTPFDGIVDSTIPTTFYSFVLYSIIGITIARTDIVPSNCLSLTYFCLVDL